MQFCWQQYQVFFWKKTFYQVINNFQTNSRTFKVWFYDNFLVLNPKKCHIMIFGNGNNLWGCLCDDIIIKNGLSEKILGLTIDNNLDFLDHVSNYVKLQIKNWMLYSEYQLIWTQINVSYWLILLLSLSSVIFRLFGCSVIRKAWKKSTQYKNVIYVYWKITTK